MWEWLTCPEPRGCSVNIIDIIEYLLWEPLCCHQARPSSQGLAVRQSKWYWGEGDPSLQRSGGQERTCGARFPGDRDSKQKLRAALCLQWVKGTRSENGRWRGPG